MFILNQNIKSFLISLTGFIPYVVITAGTIGILKLMAYFGQSVPEITPWMLFVYLLAGSQIENLLSKYKPHQFIGYTMFLVVILPRWAGMIDQNVVLTCCAIIGGISLNYTLRTDLWYPYVALKRDR
jgi:hypothetical protein